MRLILKSSFQVLALQSQAAAANATIASNNVLIAANMASLNRVVSLLTELVVCNGTYQLYNFSSSGVPYCANFTACAANAFQVFPGTSTTDRVCVTNVTSSTDVTNLPPTELSGYSVIGGTLTFRNYAGDITVDSVVYVNGDLIISQCASTQIVFTKLLLVQNILNIDSNNIATVVLLPNLQTVVSSFFVKSNAALTFLSIPLLTSIGGAIAICANAEIFELPPILVLSYRYQPCAVLNGSAACPIVPQPCIGPSTYIGSTSSLDLIASSSSVTGNIILQDVSITAVNLPLLYYIGGNLSMISEVYLSQVVLPMLTFSGGFDFDTMSAGSLLTIIDLPHLRLVNGSVFIGSSVPQSSTPLIPLAMLNVPTLTWIASYFTISFTNALTLLQLPNLLYVGGQFSLDTDVGLLGLQANVLTYVGDGVYIANNNRQTLISLAALVSIRTTLYIASDASLSLISMNALQSIGAYAYFVALPGLAVLSLPSLTTVATRTVNPAFEIITAALTTLDMPAITQIGGNVVICDNGASLQVSPNVSTAAVGHMCRLPANGVCPTSLAPCLTTYYGSFNGIVPYGVNFALVAAVTGFVNLSSSAIPNMTFPLLSFVGSDMILLYGGVQIISFASLQIVNGTLNVGVAGTGGATIVSFPSLTYVAGDCFIAQSGMTVNSALTYLNFNSLSFVGGTLDMSNNLVLTAITLPALTFVGNDFIVIDSLSLVLMSAPSLTSIGGQMSVYSLNSFSSMSLTALGFIGNGITSYLCTFMTILYLPSLNFVPWALEIQNQPALTGINFPSLTYAGTVQTEIGVYISYNQMLTWLSMPSLATLAGIVEICFNGLNFIVPWSIAATVSSSASCQLPLTPGAVCQTSGPCPSVSYSSVSNNASASQLAQSTAVFGSITFIGSDITSFAPPFLQYVSGTLSLTGNLMLTYVSVPVLTYVGGSVAVSIASGSNSLLVSVYFPSLTYVSGGVMISTTAVNNHGIMYINLNSLQYVGGAFSILSASLAPSLVFPALTFVGANLQVSNTTGLISLSFPALTLVVGPVKNVVLVISGNTALQTLSAPLLTKVMGQAVLCMNSQQFICPVNVLLAVSLNACRTSMSGSGCVSSANCASIYYGNVTSSVFSTLSTASSPPYVMLNGTLNITTSPLMVVSASSLGVIQGQVLLIGNIVMTLVSFPSLTFIGSDFIVDANAQIGACKLTTINVPYLQYVGGSFQVTNSLSLNVPSLVALNAPYLSTVVGDFTIYYAPNLLQTSVLGSLTSVGSLNIRASGLSGVTCPQLLTSINGFLLVNTSGVSLFNLPLLTSVSSSFLIASNTGLSVVLLQQLQTVANSVNIGTNLILTYVDMSALSQVRGAFKISGNPNLAIVNMPSIKLIGSSFSTCANSHSLTFTNSVYMAAANQACMLGFGPYCTPALNCSFVYIGDVHNNIPNSTLAQYSVIAGSIDYTNYTAAQLVLPSLVAIQSSLYFTYASNSTTTLIMTGLVYVGGDIAITSLLTSAVYLSYVSFPSLSWIGGSLSAQSVFYGYVLSGYLLFPVLQSIGSTLQFSTQSSPNNVTLPLLTFVGGALVIDQMQVLTLGLPKLCYVGASISLSNLPLTVVNLPQLTAIGTYLSILSNAALTYVGMPVLKTIAFYMTIKANQQLTTVVATSVTAINGTITICNNNLLAAPAISAQIKAAGVFSGVMCATVYNNCSATTNCLT